MQFSREREAEIIEQNMPKIYRSVDNYMAKCTNDLAVKIDYADMVQEVSIAFLEYIRNKCETEEDIEKFPWYDAKHAMSTLVLKSQPFGCPHSTKYFKDTLRKIPQTCSYDVMVDSGMEVDGMAKNWVSVKDFMMDFDTFMSGQPENVQRMASMMLRGMTIDEVANQCGTNYQFVFKKFKKLRQEYEKFKQGGQDDE